MGVQTPIERPSPVDLIYCPGGEAERDLRKRIAGARDTALLRASAERTLAVREIYWLIVDHSQPYITGAASIEKLQKVRRVAVRLFQSAMELEALEAHDD